MTRVPATESPPPPGRMDRLYRGWCRFAAAVAVVAAPVNVAVTFVILSLMYWLLLPFWTVFMVWGDPLRRRLDPARESYFEVREPEGATLERLSHGS